MGMPIKKHDFVEIDYTGRIKDTNEVFDTTDEKTAKEAQVFTQGAAYKPVIICVGEHHILPGIDEFLIGKDVGNHKIDLEPDKAFGKKRAELVRMLPQKRFEEQKIQPMPGLRLNIDGSIGIIKSVSGGRVVLDFNHPLAGRDVSYDIKINRVVSDKKEQVSSLMRVLLGVREPKVEVDGKKAKVFLPVELPKELLDALSKKISDLTGLNLEIVVEKKDKK